MRIHKLGTTAATLIAALTWFTRPASAQTAQERAAAEALFEEGLRLIEAKKFDDACPKLEASQKLDPGVGTLLYLADCYSNQGRTASAWSTFLEAAYAAKAAGDTDRQQVATELADELKGKLAYLKIQVAQPVPQDFTIERDGRPVAAAVWGVPTPVDPGSHEIVARAPGHHEWAHAQVVQAEPGTVTVEVPMLELKAPETTAAPPPPMIAPPTPGPVAPAEPAVEDTGTSAGSSQATWGWVVGGVGVAALGAGGIFALSARSSDREADSHCRPENPSLCDAQGVELGEDANSAATMATLLGGGGLALVTTGVVILLTAPSDAPSAAEAPSRRVGWQFTPHLDDHQAGVGFQGVF